METSQFTFKQKVRVTSRPSAEKVMFIVFWGSQGVLLAHFQKRGENVNSVSYCDCEVLLNIRDTICRKPPGQLARGLLLHHDNAVLHTAREPRRKFRNYSGNFLNIRLTART
jgi:hypothetical protein